MVRKLLTGNLNDNERASLSQMWRVFFHVLNHPEEYTHNAGEAHLNPEQAKAIAEDGPPSQTMSANEKESKAHQEEQAALSDVLVHHGVQKFYDSFWFLCGPDPPDMVMLKFLRARKWNVERAVAMLARCIKWRIDVDVAGIVEKGDLGLSQEDPAYLKQGEVGKAYAASASKENMPIVFFEVQKHYAKGQGSDTMRKFAVISSESFRALMSYPHDKCVITDQNYYCV